MDRNPSDFDREAIQRVARIICEMKAHEKDPVYWNRIADEIYQHQPFMLSLLMGYKTDLQKEALDEVIKIYVWLWEHFKMFPGVCTNRITASMFEEMQEREIGWLQSLEALEGKQKEAMLLNGFSKFDSSALVSAVYFRFRDVPALADMSVQDKGMVLIGIVSMIRCFEMVCEQPSAKKRGSQSGPPL